MKRVILILAFSIGVALFNEVDAQCSMCRFMAESSYANGSDIGKGLNNGILYIMFIPYILLLSVGFLLFKNREKVFNLKGFQRN